MRTEGWDQSEFITLSIPDFLSYLAHSQTHCISRYGAFCVIFTVPDMLSQSLPPPAHQSELEAESIWRCAHGVRKLRLGIALNSTGEGGTGSALYRDIGSDWGPRGGQ